MFSPYLTSLGFIHGSLESSFITKYSLQMHTSANKKQIRSTNTLHTHYYQRQTDLGTYFINISCQLVNISTNISFTRTFATEFRTGRGGNRCAMAWHEELALSLHLLILQPLALNHVHFWETPESSWILTELWFIAVISDVWMAASHKGRCLLRVKARGAHLAGRCDAPSNLLG